MCQVKRVEAVIRIRCWTSAAAALQRHTVAAKARMLYCLHMGEGRAGGCGWWLRLRGRAFSSSCVREHADSD